MNTDDKIDRILTLLEKQESRARKALWWKMFWIVALVIIPTWFSYIAFTKMASGNGGLSSMFSLPNLESSLQEAKNLQK